MTDHTITTTSSSLLRRSIVGLATLALLGGSACDLEGPDGLESDIAAQEEDEEDQRLELSLTDDEHIAVSLPEAQDDSLAITAASSDPLTLVDAYTYDGASKLVHLADGDVIMLKNFARGYLGCNDAGDVFSDQDPLNNDQYLWTIHRVDLDNDGADEVQLERLAGPGEFLKLDGSNSAYCGVITGSGTAASWDVGGPRVAYGSYYRRISAPLQNYMTSKCLKISSDSGANGTNCNNTTGHLFFFEIVDHA